MSDMKASAPALAETAKVQGGELEGLIAKLEAATAADTMLDFEIQQITEGWRNVGGGWREWVGGRRERWNYISHSPAVTSSIDAAVALGVRLGHDRAGLLCNAIQTMWFERGPNAPAATVADICKYVLLLILRSLPPSGVNDATP